MRPSAGEKILTRGIKGNWRDKKRCGNLPQVSNILLPAKNSAMPKVRKSPIRNVVARDEAIFVFRHVWSVVGACRHLSNHVGVGTNSTYV